MPTPPPLSHLFPTQPRVDLLMLVAAGLVYEPVWEPQTFRVQDGPTVTNQIKEMRRAGWVKFVAANRDVEVRLRQVVPDTLGKGILARVPKGAR